MVVAGRVTAVAVLVAADGASRAMGQELGEQIVESPREGLVQQAWDEAELAPAAAEELAASQRTELDRDFARAVTSRASAEPASLPTGPGKSAVTAQAISLPKPEGPMRGMGESFSPALSSGGAAFSVPIELPSGRAGAQPLLSLAYSSSGGSSVVGMGWSLDVPSISRQTDRGLPRYVDQASWHPREDRFVYSGGQELVPVSSAEMTALDNAPVPSELSGYPQYRSRIEGAFMRFFRAPDGSRWVVHAPDGSLLDVGRLAAGDGPSPAVTASVSAIESEDASGSGRVFRWLLTRMSDAHDSTVYYQYTADQGARYLSDIYYVSPASCGADGSTVAARRSCNTQTWARILGTYSCAGPYWTWHARQVGRHTDEHAGVATRPSRVFRACLHSLRSCHLARHRR